MIRSFVLIFAVVCLYYVNEMLGTTDPDLSQKGKIPVSLL